MEQNFSEFRVYVDQKVLTEKHDKEERFVEKCDRFGRLPESLCKI